MAWTIVRGPMFLKMMAVDEATMEEEIIRLHFMHYF